MTSALGRVLTVFWISWLNLRRDRVALGLSFVLPLVFFSIFAAVFGGMDEGGAAPVEATLLMADEGDLGTLFAERLAASETLELVGSPSDALAARNLVRSGAASLAVVVPAEFSSSFNPEGETSARLEILADVSNPLALQRAIAVLQSTALELGYELGLEEDDTAAAVEAANLPAGPLTIEIVDVLGGAGKRPSIAFFAAGIGVMFLLFSVSGRSAILIEEKESGVLTRMLTSRLTLPELLLGRFFYLALLGFVQVSLMFTWGALIFDLELFTPRHLAGFAVLTAVTAAAAAGFGLVLAAACKTRAQLNGVASVVILVMSALGGSMFPRFLMPEHLQDVGLLTFNAWALDGYQKIFWYEAKVTELGTQLGVLVVLAVAFLVMAGGLARRWEQV